jgi:hypothetical protein
MGGYIDITTSVSAGISAFSGKLFPTNKQEPELREISKGHFLKCPFNYINEYFFIFLTWIERILCCQESPESMVKLR